MSGFTYYNLRKHPINLAAWRGFAIGFLAGGTNIIGITGNLNLNAQGGETSLLVPLTNLYVVIPVAAGVLFLGDKFTLKKGFGILLGIAATMMFAFGGGSSFDLGKPSTMGFFFMTILGRLALHCVTCHVTCDSRVLSYLSFNSRGLLLTLCCLQDGVYVRHYTKWLA